MGIYLTLNKFLFGYRANPNGPLGTNGLRIKSLFNIINKW